jgi:hypothetical protein
MTQQGKKMGILAIKDGSPYKDFTLNEFIPMHYTFARSDGIAGGRTNRWMLRIL